MTLNNIKTLKKDRGFTIVELLIVIVVIAILAAITVVAFNGIQNRAKTTAGKSLAGQVAKKAEIWNTVQSYYPSYTQLTTNVATPADGATAAVNGPTEAKIDQAGSVLDSTTAEAVTAAAADGGNKIGYKPCGTAAPYTGAVLSYWDYAESPAVVKTITIGSGC